MLLTPHHITSHCTGFPILARVPTQNFSNFQSIHVTLCVCLYQMALLFQNVHLRDPLKVWNSQGSRFTVSLYSLSGWRWAFVPTNDAWKARRFWQFCSFQIYNIHVQILSANYKATRPVYCIASHHEPSPDHLHNSTSSHQWQLSPIFGCWNLETFPDEVCVRHGMSSG